MKKHNHTMFSFIKRNKETSKKQNSSTDLSETGKAIDADTLFEALEEDMNALLLLLLKA